MLNVCTNCCFLSIYLFIIIFLKNLDLQSHLSQGLPRGPRPFLDQLVEQSPAPWNLNETGVCASTLPKVRRATFSSFLPLVNSQLLSHLHVQLGDKALLILVTELEEFPRLFKHLHLHVLQFAHLAGRRSTRSHFIFLVPLLFCFPVDASQERSPLVLHLFNVLRPRAGENGRAVGQKREKPQSNTTLCFWPTHHLVTHHAGLKEPDVYHNCRPGQRQWWAVRRICAWDGGKRNRNASLSPLLPTPTADHPLLMFSREHFPNTNSILFHVITAHAQKRSEHSYTGI